MWASSMPSAGWGRGGVLGVGRILGGNKQKTGVSSLKRAALLCRGAFLSCVSEILSQV